MTNREQENKDKRILLCLNHLCGREREYVDAAVDAGWTVPLGPDVNAFEESLARNMGQDISVVALSAGTAAIHLGLLCAGVKPGDEVIVQSMTFSASANPVAYCGARPVFVDSEAQTYNIDPNLLEQAIISRHKATGRYPAAIIPVALYGMPPQIDRISEISRIYGIPVVMDAAEAMGSLYKGRECATFGDYGILSFNGNKMITTSGGGALICHDPERARHALFLATQARENHPWYEHLHIGYNYRLSNISAAIGRGQMHVLDEHLRHHRELHDVYTGLLKNTDGVSVHQNPTPDYDSNFWLTTILLSSEAAGTGREGEPGPGVLALREALAARNIESRPLWKPMHMQPVFRDAPSFVNGVSESLFTRGLCLPSGPCVSKKDVHKICAIIADSVS